MDGTIRIERDLDEAKDRLDKLNAIKATLLDKHRAAYQEAQEAAGHADSPLVLARLRRELDAAMAVSKQTVDDLLDDEFTVCKQEIEQAEQELSAAEDADMRRTYNSMINVGGYR